MPEEILRLIDIAIEPKVRGDEERLVAALAELAANDPRLRISTDSESGQAILQGVSQGHLEEVLDRLEIPFHVGAPQVAYREGLREAATIRYCHKRQSGGSGEFAWVEIAFEPLAGDPRDSIVFQNTSDGPPEFVQAVEKGIRSQAQSGLAAGFPVIDFKATLTEIRYHEVDSTARTFDIAARAAFRQLAEKDGVQILEPIMTVEIATPRDTWKDVIMDFDSRCGYTYVPTEGEIFVLVTAQVPLANMLDYSRTLNAMTSGRAAFEMRFERFAPAPLPSRDGDPNFPGAMAMRA